MVSGKTQKALCYRVHRQASEDVAVECIDQKVTMGAHKLVRLQRADLTGTTQHLLLLLT